MRSTRPLLLVVLLACTVEGIEFKDAPKNDAGTTPPTKKDGGTSEKDSGGDPQPIDDSGTPIQQDTGGPIVVANPCEEDRLVAGNRDLTGLQIDNVLANEVVAFGFKPVSAENARCLRLHVSSATTNPIRLALYSDTGTAPGALLASGTIAAPVVGWNKIILDKAIPTNTETRLWLATTTVASEFDMLTKRDCNGRHRHTTTSGALPATFVSGGEEIYCQPAFYLTP